LIILKVIFNAGVGGTRGALALSRLRWGDGGFEEAADVALLGNAFAGGGGADGVQEGAGEPHVEALVLGLKLEADGAEGGEVELGEVGGSDEGFRGLVSGEIG
jgi:hypothetical protein